MPIYVFEPEIFDAIQRLIEAQKPVEIIKLQEDDENRIKVNIKKAIDFLGLSKVESLKN